MGKTFSGCEIVELAVQVEKNGRDFFGMVAERSKHQEARETFERLAEEDGRHMESFRDIFSNMCRYEPSGAYPEEYFAYMRALAENYVFTQEDKGAEIARNTETVEDAVRTGISYVKDALLFYEGVRGLVAEGDAGMVDRLIKEERDHLTRLCELKPKVCG